MPPHLFKLGPDRWQADKWVPIDGEKNAFTPISVKRVMVRGKLEGETFGSFEMILHCHTRSITLTKTDGNLNIMQASWAVKKTLEQIVGKESVGMPSNGEESTLLSFSPNLTQEQVNFSIHQLREHGVDYEKGKRLNPGFL